MFFSENEILTAPCAAHRHPFLSLPYQSLRCPIVSKIPSSMEQLLEALTRHLPYFLTGGDMANMVGTRQTHEEEARGQKGRARGRIQRAARRDDERWLVQ